MSIWGIADLHLSFEVNKPMDVFGDRWKDYVKKIEEGWKSRVNSDDLVVIPGDISWAISLSETGKDFAWLDKLPGTKVILRGNHDYWWSTITRVRKALPPTIHALQNDHLSWGGWAICGTRGWICPGEPRFDPERDQKIYLRETHRLELSLESAYKEGKEDIVAALHYPPFSSRREESGFTRLLTSYGVKHCLYGHLHGEALEQAYQGNIEGVEYHFVSADALNFTPALIVS